jgi:SNF2 family DNA or RNA helicase
MMATADISHAGDIVVDCDSRELGLMAQLPGARWNDSTRVWAMPLTWPAVMQLRGTFAAHLTISDRLREWYNHEWSTRVGPCLWLRDQPDFEIPGPTGARLRPLQRVGAMHMATARRSLMGDDMGGGKTPMTIAALKLRHAMDGGGKEWGPTLIVCPRKVKRVWSDHFAEWWPTARVAVAGDTAKKKRDAIALVARGEADVLVINWDSLVSFSRLEPFGNITMTDKQKEPKELNAIQWRAVVADEAHRMLDRKAQWTRAIKAVAFGTSACGTAGAEYRWALSGTPGEDADDQWSIWNFLEEREAPAYTKHIDRYAATSWNRFGGLEIGGVKPEADEEYRTAYYCRFIRRPLSLLNPGIEVLPPQDLWVPMEPKQKKAYNQLADEWIAELDASLGDGAMGTPGHLVETSAMTRGARLCQLACSYGEMSDKGRRDEDGGIQLELQLQAPSNKVVAMMELVEEAGSGAWGSTPLLFGAASRQLLAVAERALDKAKVPYSILAGGQPDAEAAEQERRFNDGETSVCLVSLGASSEGLNGLQRANIVVFLQESWKRHENKQFVGRAARGDEKQVVVKRVLSEGTIEEWKQSQLAGKDVAFEELWRDADAVRAILATRAK